MSSNDRKQYAFDFFISYAKADEAWVRNFLISRLRDAGTSVATFEDFGRTNSGVPKPINAEQAVSNSHKVLIVITPEYFSDPENNDYNQFIEPLRQHKNVIEKEHNLIPLIYKEADLPSRLDFLEQVDFSKEENWQSSIDHLLENVGKASNKKYQKPPCPYIGLDFFEEGQQDKFYGREKLIDQLKWQLEASKFITIIGSSGSGKSSLVNAGLIPAMKRNVQLGEGSCVSFRLTPAHDPIRKIKSVFGDDVAVDPQKTVVNYLSEKSASKLVLFIDQFEELFALARGAEDEFCALLNTLSNIDGLFIILAVRSEFYKDLTLSGIWDLVDGNYCTLRPLLREQLARVIRLPAQEAGVGVDPLLIERVINDAGREPGILPFVQVTLRLLWKGLDNSYLSLAAYEGLRSPYSNDENVTGLHAAIAIQAHAAMVKFKKEGKEDIVRCLFLRLVNFGENGAPDTRSPKKLSELSSCGSGFEEVIQDLSSGNVRLLMTSRGEDVSDPVVNIVHDSVIVGWPKLLEWINKFRQIEQQRKKFEFKLSEWARFGKSDAGLLSQAEVDEANYWIGNKNDRIFGVNPLFYEFLDKSKLNINPGWSFFGGIALCLIVISLFFLALYLFYYLYSSISGFLRYSIILLYLVFFASLSFVAWVQLSKRKFFINFLSSWCDNYFSYIASIFLFVVSCFFWFSAGNNYFEEVGSCYKSGFRQDISSHDQYSFSVNHDVNEGNGHLHRLFLTAFGGRYKDLNLVPLSGISKCNVVSNGHVTFGINSLDNKDFFIDIEVLNNENSVIFSKRIADKGDEAKKCRKSMEMAFFLGNFLNKSRNTIVDQEKEVENSSCSAFVQFLEAYKAASVNIPLSKKLFLNLLTIEPNNNYYILEYVTFLLRYENNYIEAFDVLEKHKENFKNLNKFKKSMAHACLLTSQYECSIENLMKILKSHGDDATTFNMISIVYREAGDFTLAEDWLEKSIKFSVTEREFYNYSRNQAIIFHKKKEYKNSIEAFRSILEKYPESYENNKQILFYNALNYHFIGDIFKSCEYYFDFLSSGERFTLFSKEKKHLIHATLNYCIGDKK